MATLSIQLAKQQLLSCNNLNAILSAFSLSDEDFEQYISHLELSPEEIIIILDRIKETLSKYPNQDERNAESYLPNALFTLLQGGLYTQIKPQVQELVQIMGNLSNYYHFNESHILKIMNLFFETCPWLLPVYAGCLQQSTIQRLWDKIYQYKNEYRQFKEMLMNMLDDEDEDIYIKTDNIIKRAEYYLTIENEKAVDILKQHSLDLTEKLAQISTTRRAISQQIDQDGHKSQESTELYSQIAQLNIQNAQLEQRVTILTQDNKLANERISRLQENLQQKQQQINAFNSEKQALEVQIEFLRHQINSLTEPPQLRPFRCIGTDKCHAIFEFDNNRLIPTTIQNLTIDNYPTCVNLKNRSLFICGGFSYDSTCIINSSCQKLEIAQMNRFRSRSAIIHVESQIYVFGGSLTYYTDGRNPQSGSLKSCERYDIVNDTWSPIADLPERRSDFGAAYYRDNIYLGGGFTDFDETKCGIIYRYNIFRNEYEITSMQAPQGGVGSTMFAVRNVLHILREPNLLAIYDLDTEEWFGNFFVGKYNWWSSMQPIVVGEDAYLALTDKTKMLVKFNVRSRETVELGRLA